MNRTKFAVIFTLRKTYFIIILLSYGKQLLRDHGRWHWKSFLAVQSNPFT